MSREADNSRWMLPLFLMAALSMLLLPESRVQEWRGSAFSTLSPLMRLTSKLRLAAKPEAATIVVPFTRPDAPAPQNSVDVKAQIIEIDNLRTELVSARSEIQRLRNSGPLPGAPLGLVRDIPGIDATIIARQIMWQEPLLGIDKGESAGVRVNSPVLHRGAVLGRVVACGPQAASVAPLTHRGVCVTARLSDCRAEGVMQGGKTEKDEKLCKMTIVGREMNARVGEQVMTSGTDGSFPAGLWMGTVCAIRKSSEMQWELTIRPACRESAVEDVRVLPLSKQDVPWPRQPVKRR